MCNVYTLKNIDLSIKIKHYEEELKYFINSIINL